MTAPAPKNNPKKNGLEYWMAQVLKEASRAAASFDSESVHDLRVALRRCRSIAEVAQGFDPDPAWKKMRKAGKQVFSSLGDLRDCQVLMEWVTKLSGDDDPVRTRLLAQLQQDEQRLKEMAAEALTAFEVNQWRKWSKYLSRRIARYRAEGELFQGLALARWHNARELHLAASRTRSKVSLHRLRIGVKKLRYVVENFLPSLHQNAGKSLKEVQDLLGEVHDLDVLWERAIQTHAFDDPESRTRWQEVINGERTQRTERYKELSRGDDSIWREWRSQLPVGAAADRASWRRIRTWSSLLDPDPAHSRRVAQIALKVYDALVRDKVFRPSNNNTRIILGAAATMHDVGKDGKSRSHHKRSSKLISKFQLPYGWTDEDLAVVGQTARYHRGALPNLKQKGFRQLSPKERPRTKQLGAILRFSDALDYAQAGLPSQLSIRREGNQILVTSNKLVNGTREAERVAGARYLLELICGLPIVVRGVRRSSTRKRPSGRSKVRQSRSIGTRSN